MEALLLSAVECTWR